MKKLLLIVILSAIIMLAGCETANDYICKAEEKVKSSYVIKKGQGTQETFVLEQQYNADDSAQYYTLGETAQFQNNEHTFEFTITGLRLVENINEDTTIKEGLINPDLIMVDGSFSDQNNLVVLDITFKNVNSPGLEENFVFSANFGAIINDMAYGQLECAYFDKLGDMYNDEKRRLKFKVPKGELFNYKVGYLVSKSDIKENKLSFLIGADFPHPLYLKLNMEDAE